MNIIALLLLAAVAVLFIVFVAVAEYRDGKTTHYKNGRYF
jgi:hypothetical protein